MLQIKTLLASAIVASLATSAHAATVTPPQPPELYGGGATNPAIAYVGSAWLAGTSADPGVPSRLSTTNPNVVGGAVNLTPADADSLFGVYATETTSAIEYITTTVNGGTPVVTSTTKAVKTANPNISYCQAGSSAGRAVLAGSASATTPCTDYNTSPTGFGAPVDAAFETSDAPLQASDYTTFEANRGTTKTEPVQFPAIASAIAIAYNPTSTGLASGTQLNLTESQICQIFAGQVATWGQLLGNGNTTPITVVYRVDNAGASFSFSNHLAKVCPSAVGGAVANVYTTNSNFSSLGKSGSVNKSYGDANFLNSSPNGSELISGSLAPVAAVGENGNGAVVTEINNLPGSIGYAEAADAKSRAAEAGSSIDYATVSIQSNVPVTYYCSATPSTTVEAPNPKPTCSGKGNKLVTVKAQNFKAWDPITDLAKSLKVNFLSDKVLIGSTTGGELESVTTALGGTAPKNPGCLQVVDPATYAIPLITKGDYTDYPIISISNLDGYNTGNSVTVNSTNAAGQPVVTVTDEHAFVASLFSLPYNLPKTVGTIGAGLTKLGTGYAALVPTLDTGAAGGATKPATVVANCVLQ